MSTETITPTRPDPRAMGPKVPFGRLVRVETRKLVDTRAGLWLLIGMAAIIVLYMILFLINGSPDELKFSNFFVGSVQPLQYLLPLMAAMAITGEWTQRAGLTTFTLEPSRARLIASKVAAAFTLCIVLMGVVVVVSAFTNVLGVGLRDSDGEWGLDGSDMRAMLIGVVIFVLFGIAMGMVTLNTPAALVITLFGPLIGAIILSIPGIRRVADWISLFDAWGKIWEETSPGIWARLAVAVSVWIVLPLVVGSVRVFKSEVK